MSQTWQQAVVTCLSNRPDPSQGIADSLRAPTPRMVPLEAFRAKFPWARFLAEGGFKQVYMVFNAEM
ncbi:MAG: hypothetical protein ACPIOQ_36845, partial [Promethearchaeia archaeon]